MTKGYTYYTYTLTLSIALMVNGILYAQKTPLLTNNNIVELTDYAPLLTDVWGGVNCVDDNGDRINPSNYYTPNNCSPGCVAISAAQIYHYYEWPKTGIGSQVYLDKSGTEYNYRHSAFFDNVEYDWSNMLDEYKYVASSDVQQKAIGELIYHSAVSLAMDFEPAGSTSNVNKVPYVLENFFRFSGHYEEPETYSAFWDKMKENIKQGHPVQVAIKDVDGGGAGHAFVVDGYRESDGFYHANWGWYNRSGLNDRWFDIEFGWDGTGGGYDKVTGAVFDFLPVPQISSIKKTGVNDDIIVSWITSDFVVNDEYALEMSVDGGDWELVSEAIVDENYTISSPTGKVYKFRVKAKIDGSYYVNSWSEIEVFALSGGYDGYAAMGGLQYAYAFQTPNNDLYLGSDYTIEAWLRIDNDNVNGNVILDQAGSYSLTVSNITSTGYAISFKNYKTGSTILSIQNGNEINFDKWTHVAVSTSSGNAKLFINGLLTDESDGFNLSNSNSPLNMAERYSGGYLSRLKGDIDQLRVSRSQIYSGAFTPIKTDQFTVDNNTVAYINFQNVHGNRLKDNAANLSFRVSNTNSTVFWNYEETENELSNRDLEFITSLITVYPNPAVNDFIEITIED
ncbi:MAG: C10 family peptidase, partial [Chlamydiia bacterium]|nr:C10 family peptidase [Chlamydiia bacterium]